MRSDDLYYVNISAPGETLGPSNKLYPKETEGSPDVFTHLTLGDQLAGVELGDHSLQHLRRDGGQDTLVVVLAENGVDLGQLVWNGTVQDAERDVDILQILAARDHRDVAGLGPDVEDDGPLHPWDKEVGTLADHVLLDAGEAIEDDRPVAAFHII